MTKILILTLHRRDRAPGQRFRHEQYLAELENNGFEITYANLLSEGDDKIFYGPGNFLKKIIIGLKALTKRLLQAAKANRFQYIFIYRDAFFFGTFVEKLFSRSKAQLIYDFDDSIWLLDENVNNSFFQKLKNPDKTGKIIALCDLIIAGNEYLATYARRFNHSVRIIPTTIDTHEYKRMEISKPNTICIGWSGSFSTIKHFESAIGPLLKIKQQFGTQVTFKVIGDGNYRNDQLSIIGEPWNKATEIQNLNQIDIGIMPLPDDQWSRGKCGLKGLQYMAIGIPTIMSPVGVNKDIIEDGKNGFLAATEEDWVRKLSSLIEKKELRKEIGLAGKETVDNLYSVDQNKEKWLAVFQE